MTELGADYSWARPGGAALAAAGVKAVGRYLAADGRGITAGEYADLSAHGIGVWVCREGGASGMLNGFQQGVADAQIAVQQIAAVGLPANSIVYATADFDVQTSQFPACDAYLQGFTSVLGTVNRQGIYGGLHYLNHAHAAGLAVGFWQAGATSWNHGESAQMQIQFEQTTQTPPLPGTDHNFIYDAGLASLGGSTPITEETDSDMKLISVAGGTIAIVGELFGMKYTSVSGGQGFSIGVNRKVYGPEVTGLTEDEVATLVNEANARRTQVVSEITAAVAKSLPAGGGAGYSPAQIAAAVNAALSGDFAAIPGAVATEEAKRLVQ